MKKFLSLMLVLALVCGMLSFAGCDGDLPTDEEIYPGFTSLPQGEIPNMPEYLEGRQGKGIVYGDYLIFANHTENTLVFQLLSNPMPKGVPVAFDALAKKGENPFFNARIEPFLVDPIASAKNGGVPVILFVGYVDDTSNIMNSIRHYRLLSFNMKTQKTSVLIDHVPDRINHLLCYRDRLYFETSGGDRGSILYSLKSDGSDVQMMENHEKERRHITYAADGRLYYMADNVFLYSCKTDFSDIQAHGEVETGMRLMVHDGYLYFPEKQEAKEFNGTRLTTYHYYRAPLSDPSKKELVLEHIYPAGGPQGTLIPIFKGTDLGLDEKGKKCFRAMYLFDAASGAVKTVYSGERAYSSLIFACTDRVALWDDRSGETDITYLTDFSGKEPVMIVTDIPASSEE